ncbi:MAG TPA: DUF2231 domain-containing protein [Mycobacteriales bacterium]|jgi:uncharacterized membrane protein
MPRKFSFGPAITLKGRKYKGLRGFAGKPFHPPLTDVPVTAYLFAAVFDVWSALRDEPWMRDAASYLLVMGFAVSLLAVLTGWADWHRSSQVGTQARRTINAHAVIMIAATVFVLVDLLARTGDAKPTPGGVAALSVIAAGLTMLGSTYGGSLVFDYGFNVETSGDHPVWHESEQDVYPGAH